MNLDFSTTDAASGQAPQAAATPSTAAVHLQVEIHDLHAHLFGIELTVNKPAATQLLELPVWIPGSYLVREFSKNLQHLTASQRGQPVPLRQLDKHRWEVQADPAAPLVLRYRVYAFDNSVRTAWLDSQRGFFNGTSLFLAVDGQRDRPHDVELSAQNAPADWQVATGLPAVKTDRAGFGRYRADNYDELVDCPVELGAFFSGTFQARAVPHRFVVAGATASFDSARLLADAQKICAAQLGFWHPDQETAPFDAYLFMLNTVGDGYGGLEHRNSTALIANRADLPQIGATPAANTSKPAVQAAAAAPGDASDDHAAAASGTSATLHSALIAAARAGAEAAAVPSQHDGYVTLLGLISHEYFHSWNVKRLRPAEFARYDYTRENYTELLWFFEGFTSYYDDLILRRAGLINDATYLKLLAKSINQLRQTPGRLVQSVAQASFDAWVKYYRPDEGTPNGTVSYYGKGALVALCLDLTLRAENSTNLDQVMRALWSHCRAGPMSEADLLTVLERIGGRSYAPELAAWVHGTDELPLQRLLATQGVSVLEEPSQLAQRLGLRVGDGAPTSHGIVVKTVLSAGAAERAGLAAGDEWIGIRLPGDGRAAPRRTAASAEQASAAGTRNATGKSWRLRKLDELPMYLGEATVFTALVARDQRLLELPFVLPHNDPTWRLSLRDAARAAAWLSGSDGSRAAAASPSRWSAT